MLQQLQILVAEKLGIGQHAPYGVIPFAPGRRRDPLDVQKVKAAYDKASCGNDAVDRTHSPAFSMFALNSSIISIKSRSNSSGVSVRM